LEKVLCILIGAIWKHFLAWIKACGWLILGCEEDFNKLPLMTVEDEQKCLRPDLSDPTSLDLLLATGGM